MRDAAHPELRMEPRDGLQLIQLALSLTATLMSVLTHMQEAQGAPSARPDSHPHNGFHRKSRRPSQNGSIPTYGPGALVRLRIDAQREYKVDEVAERLGMSPQSVRKMIDTDKLKAEKRGTGRGHWIIQGAELLRFTHQTDDSQP
jgi:Helix-turn-helix domain